VIRAAFENIPQLQLIIEFAQVSLNRPAVAHPGADTGA
jgi:hypothetical protein